MSAERRKRTLNEQEQDSPSAKKPRVAGVAQPSFLPPKGDLESIANPPVVTPKPPTGAAADAIAAARAKFAAKFAAFKPGATPAPSAASTSPLTAAGASTSQASATPPPEVKNEAPAPPTGSHAAAIAEARKKIEAMKARAARSANPYLATVKSGGAAADERAGSSGPSPGIHPLLAQNEVYTARTGKDRYKPMAPKFATIKANVKQNVPVARPKYGTPAASTSKEATPGAGPSFPPGVNPYYDRSLTTEFQPKERSTNKRLRFNQKGKYTRLAEQMRQEQKLEELKARIAEASKKAGLQDEIESGALIKRPAPPDVEWWDSAYLPNKSYDDVPDDFDVENLDDKTIKHILSKLDLSSVSALIQHPIPIPAPGDKHQQAPKALFLTKKEMKKLRRNRRAAEHKDLQDRIRMGLAPPPPDKVKISNMYRVLTQEAVSDPTKVEARVRREMMARSNAHEKSNEERKLTDEQRKEKIEKKKEQDESKGIYAAVFKVRYLSDGGHKFKVRKNADQNGLSGVLIFNPKFQLVYVEGGQKGIRSYVHLMTNRIKWTEPSAAKAVNTAATPPPEASAEGTPTIGAPSVEPEGEEPPNLADNYCYLVWEGQMKDRAFRGFRPKACPSDAMAKEFLGEQQGLWDVAKRYDPDAEGA